MVMMKVYRVWHKKKKKFLHEMTEVIYLTPDSKVFAQLNGQLKDVTDDVEINMGAGITELDENRAIGETIFKMTL
jgi:hypothetical protein